MDYLWLFATAGGALILGIVIAYGVLRRRRLSADEKRAQEREVKRLYNEPRS